MKIDTNYGHLNRGSINSVDMGATYRPGIVGTYPSVIPPAVVDGSVDDPGVCSSIIRYPFTNLGRMEG